MKRDLDLDLFVVGYWLRKSYNKQFKSDSPRLAFWVWGKFGVYGVQIEFRGGVVHTLIERYVTS